MKTDILIIGGGVIGTAIAWRIAAKDSFPADGQPARVTIVDRGDDADRASFVAAGMLAPVSESVFGEEALLNLNLLALDRFPSFAHEIERAAGQETGLRTEGTLNVAYDNGDRAALDRLAAFRRGIGLPAESLDGRQARRLEPFLASNVTGGLLAPGDLSVDNRRYTSAVRAAAASAGVDTVTGDVTRIDTGTGTVTLAGGEVITATSIVLAAGHAARRVDGVPDPVRKALRPVKGQILRLRHPGNLPPIITHTVRALVQARE
ncbi:MAG TPA: FAD-dependent oxidoreductase, partial [Trebonia sp.]|nr:FAD-dependent oxidoreductase [Trebonia sp.]